MIVNRADRLPLIVSFYGLIGRKMTIVRQEKNALALSPFKDYDGVTLREYY